MFREIRRKEKLMNKSDAMEILKKCDWGVLAINGIEGYPYGVPVNHVVVGNKIVFHGAMEGHKFDAMKNGSKCSYTVVASENVLPEKLTTDFESVIVFGEVKLVTDENLRREGFVALIERFCEEYAEQQMESIEKHGEKTALFEIEIEHISGKKSVN